MGQRTVQSLRSLEFLPLCQKLRDLLPDHLLSSEDEGPCSRDRVFSLRLTFECLVWQALKPRTSCRDVVRAVQALFKSKGWGSVDDGSSAYVQARQRLPEERLLQALALTAQIADGRVAAQGHLRQRPVKVVDGSTSQLADTQMNQKRYPQPSSQKVGCGFPVLKFLPVFSLSSGAIQSVVTSDWKSHDARLFHLVWDEFNRGDVLLADRAFGNYINLAALPQRGVDVVARLNGARKLDFRKAIKRLERNDALFLWNKGVRQSDFLTDKEWDALPDQITVRIIRFTVNVRGHRTRVVVVTSLLDPVLYPAHELIALYRRRWEMELTFRHLKTTMGMEQLRCKSPEMARKELLAYLVAYNLIRCLMAEAVAEAGVMMARVSFKGTVDAVRNYSAEMRAAKSRKQREELWIKLVASIAADLVPDRPGRREPRAVKRRPKPYARLNKPRRLYTETPHRNRFWKNNPRKSRA